MCRLSAVGLAIVCAAFVTGCRSNLGGIPAAAPYAAAQDASGEQGAAGTQLPERVARFAGVGSSNTIYADMPVPRPDTTPCTVKLFVHRKFKDFTNKEFAFAPPSQCKGPWAKVVFNFDVRVTKGVQYDRTAILWVDGAVIYFGTTSEPSPTLAPHWHVERDVTDLSALFKQSSTGQVQLWNCYCPPSYTGVQIGTAYLQFYLPDKQYPAPRVPDEVIGIPYSPPLGNVATLPKTPMEVQTTLPTNIVRADLDLYLQSQSKEEQWFMCAPDHVWQRSHRALGFCRNSAFREGEVTVNGKPAGLSPIYPWIFTGGMDPYLWFPIPGVQTLEFVPFQVDLTPFAGELSNGQTQTIDVNVIRAFDYFSGAGDLELYLDNKVSKVTGALTQDTLQTPDYDVSENVSYGTGTGLFGGPTAQGTVDTRSRSNYTIAGYVNASSGKISTTVSAVSRFDNDQSYDYTAKKYVQLMVQNSHFDATSTTQTAKGKTSVSESFGYPISVSYPLLPTSSGFRLPIKVYQGYRASTSGSQIENTVVSKDTMLFNPGFQWIGVRNGSSLQLYTYKSTTPSVCYGKQIESKNNVVTSISRPGCTAKPPPRHKPKA